MGTSRVFLSYARADAEHVDSLALQLETKGLSLWRAPDISPGQEWTDSIREAIAESDVFVLFISESFKQSCALTLELGAILSARRERENVVVVPVLLPSATLDDLPDNLRTLRAMRFSSANGQDIVSAVEAAGRQAANKSRGGEREPRRLPWRQSQRELMEHRQGVELGRRRRWRFAVGVASASCLGVALLIIAGAFQLGTKSAAAQAQLDALRTALPNLERADLSGADLNNANLAAVRLRGGKLSRTSLRAAWLVNADLRDVDLGFADLEGANLSRADLRGADMTGANLANATLVGAILEEVVLDGVRLSGADLSMSIGLSDNQMDATCGDAATLLPMGLNIEMCPRRE